MNKKLSMAVAGAVLAMGASAANAGITIPAGDWTIDIGGNVNAYFTSVDCDTAPAGYTGAAIGGACTGDDDVRNIRTGLLPSALGIGGKTRQNDLDIAFQFTFFVGADDNNGGQAGGNNSINIRQAYGSFGDKSWGTVKFGRDLGIFGSDAILSDMTLLGVGHGAQGTGGSSTLGRIGAGYLYADWVGQISYASPNWNGFSFAVGLRDPWSSFGAGTNASEDMGYEGKVSYEWGGDVSGKVWAGYISQDMKSSTAAGFTINSTGVIVPVAATSTDFDAHSWEIGAKVAMAGFEVVGNYQDGEGTGQALLGYLGADSTGKELDSQSWYVQATYKVPTVGTKIGVSYGESTVDDFAGVGSGDLENKSWMIGVYHPLTKSLNLVAEYVDAETEEGSLDVESDTISLGAIMFF